ncbi:hypothetical protein ZYGR_0N06970 [Zygosaccharomyces rouxii]|uniref:ZYRO0D16280p n=2 Tax=Zygosaccharomyces rouxii TaxID=4956 RepID=C5DWN6_ZYGRC|nr:uncharacterized protein ZYRO0D16280g [Zygosaccharomyces rouxii]KAH9201115.1 hypothetical protein LQ764DRAFT_103521 [Zygosaccharomyces rouxii]GAV49290.1 hypothetical protein ZYGR_0N06970 [Zygosaccharomyces rouxii]CAR28205.1 ZYRO0D16280p [Zygosaccharomyces rouxii]
MHTLLNPLSLPQRLLRKALYPPTLGLLLAALLAVWTIGCLIESKTAAIELTTTISNTTNTWNVDSKSLESIATSFVTVQKDQIHDHMIEYVAAHVYSGCRSAITSWNQSLSTSVHAQQIMYGYMLDLNKTITNVLYDKSKQINESLNALRVSDASQLSVNYWFVDYLFHNVSTNNTKLNDLKLNFPVISNSTKLNLPNISANSFLSKVNKISNQSSEKTTATAKVQNHRFSTHLASHCRVITAIMVTTYVVCTIGMCLYEWLKFKWETLIFKKHVDLHLHPLEKLEEEEGPIKAQQRSYHFARQLVFTMNNAPLYWISNWIGARKVKEGKKWDLLVNIQWWILSNTGYFLLLLLTVVIHWQICVSMIHTSSNQLSTLEKSQSKQAHNLTNTSTNTNNAKFYLQFTQECHNFELHLFQTLNNSIYNQLWSHNGVIATTLDNVNDQMSNLVKEVQVASPPQWNNLSLSNFVYPWLPSSNSDYNSTIDSLSLQCLKSGAVSRRQTTIVSIGSSFLNTTNMQEGLVTTELHKWTIASLIVTMAIFYLLGLTVFTNL